jgi:hypothetical protein
MQRDKQKNMVMLAIAALILVATNMGVWLATKDGVITPVGNELLWGAFVVLNMASILWAAVLLGVQPVVVSLAYLAGGFLAFRGVQGMSGVSVAEVASAGAIYGAFGALAIGNATAKVRLAFYDKKQIPFIFVIVGLLIMDTALNSGVSNAGGGVIVRAVVLPFVLAGGVVGLIWAGVCRFGAQKPSRLANAHAAEQATAEAEKVAEAKKSKKIQKHAGSPVKAKPAVAEKKVAVEQERKKAPERVVAREAQPATKAQKHVEPVAHPVSAETRMASAKSVSQKEIAAITSREIEKEEAVVVARKTYAEPEKASPFTVPGFDTSRYASRSDHAGSGGVMVEEPITSVSLDSDETVAAVSKAPASTAKKPDPENAASEDWLNGHLDLLNKLK